MKISKVTRENPGRAHHMIGDRMAGTVVAISSELPPRTSSVFMPQKGPKSRPAEVRASVVAEKDGKPSGAKGRRKVEA